MSALPTASPCTPTATSHRVVSPTIPPGREAAAVPGPATPRWRVVVLDDDARSRAALGAAIARAGGRTAAESTLCSGALDLVQRAQADVVIVASDLPEGDAISVAAEATAVACCPVVLVGREATAALVARALQAGVMGFLLKPLRRGQIAPTLDLAVARFREAQRLRRALEDRKVIERAKGRLMEREELTEDEAFRTLRTTAMNTRRPMAAIARDVLARNEATEVHRSGMQAPE